MAEMACAAAGLAKRVTVHALQHSFATLLLERLFARRMSRTLTPRGGKPQWQVTRHRSRQGRVQNGPKLS